MTSDKEQLRELEKLVEYAIVEGEWECPEGCNNPMSDPDHGELCAECHEDEIESVREPVAIGHAALLEYLENKVWKTKTND